MGIKEFLLQVQYLDKEISVKQEEIEKIESLAYYNSPSFDKIGSGSIDVHSREGLMCKIVDYKKYVDEDTEKLISLKNEIMHMINEIDDPNIRMVLILRYIQFYDFESIAKKIQYSSAQVFNFHKKGLNKLAECGFGEKKKEARKLDVWEIEI